MTLTDTETDALAGGMYRWDLVLINGSGERLGPFAAGEIEVLDMNSQP